MGWRGQITPCGRMKGGSCWGGLPFFAGFLDVVGGMEVIDRFDMRFEVIEMFLVVLRYRARISIEYFAISNSH